MDNMIKQFSDENRFLSNFWMVPITDPDDPSLVYPSVEHYYQAQKTHSMDERMPFTDSALTSGQAKKLGRKVTQRNGWDEMKEAVMEYGLRQKFAKRNSQLRVLLLETGDCYIQEGNMWKDVVWGVDLKSGEGENRLGKMLMQIRQEMNDRLM